VAASREAVLAAIREAGLPPTALPPPWRPDTPETEGLFEQFAAALEEAGGTARRVRAASLSGELEEHARALAASTLYSTHPALPSRHGDRAPRAPHDLAHLDLAILAGGPAVAESGAVWVVPESGLDRAAGFLAEHVALVVDAGALVGDLHEAYARIDPAAAGFGCFMAGPSKTADIEQVLVVGAHGARTLTAFVVG